MGLGSLNGGTDSFIGGALTMDPSYAGATGGLNAGLARLPQPTPTVEQLSAQQADIERRGNVVDQQRIQEEVNTQMADNTYIPRESSFLPSGLATSTRDQLQRMANGPNYVNVDDAVQRNARQGQNTLAAQLAAQAAGQGTSAADIQMQQGTQQAILAQQAAAATGGNSVNPFLLQRQIAQQGAAMQQQGVAQNSLLRAQETQAAQQALGTIYNQQGTQALQAAIAGKQLGQSNQQFGLSGLSNIDTRDASALQNYENMRQNGSLGLANLVNQSEMNTANNDAGTRNAIIGGISNAVAATAGGAARSMSNSAPAAAKYSSPLMDNAITTAQARLRG